LSKILTPYDNSLTQPILEYAGVDTLIGPAVLSTSTSDPYNVGGGVLNSKGFHIIGNSRTNHVRVNPDNTFTPFSTSEAIARNMLGTKITDNLLFIMSIGSGIPNLRATDGLTWNILQSNFPDGQDTIIAPVVGTQDELFLGSLDVPAKLFKSVDLGDTFRLSESFDNIFSYGIWHAANDEKIYLFMGGDQGLLLKRNNVNTVIGTDYPIYLSTGVIKWPFAIVTMIHSGKVMVTNDGFVTKQYYNFPLTATDLRHNNMICGAGNVFMVIVASWAAIFYTINKGKNWGTIQLPEIVTLGSHFTGDGRDFYLHIANSLKVYRFKFR
jgi:hypothetical protein